MIVVVIFVAASVVLFGSIILGLLPKRLTRGFEPRPEVVLSWVVVAMLFAAPLIVLPVPVAAAVLIWAVLASRGYLLDSFFKLQWSGVHGWDKACLWAEVLWSWAEPWLLLWDSSGLCSEVSLQ